MRSGNTYRFSLQFGSDTESKIRAGELLERLGNKKSTIVVTAINDYLDKHPELENGTLRIEIKEKNHMRREQLESIIRAIVMEQLQARNACPEPPPSEEPDLIQKGIAAMLDNLEFFQ